VVITQKNIDTLGGTLILFYFYKKGLPSSYEKINNCPTLVELHCPHFFFTMHLYTNVGQVSANGH
jgi:hypothetical protein